MRKSLGDNKWVLLWQKLDRGSRFLCVLFALALVTLVMILCFAWRARTSGQRVMKKLSALTENQVETIVFSDRTGIKMQLSEPSEIADFVHYLIDLETWYPNHPVYSHALLVEIQMKTGEIVQMNLFLMKGTADSTVYVALVKQSSWHNVSLGNAKSTRLLPWLVKNGLVDEEADAE